MMRDVQMLQNSMICPHFFVSGQLYCHCVYDVLHMINTTKK